MNIQYLVACFWWWIKAILLNNILFFQPDAPKCSIVVYMYRNICLYFSIKKKKKVLLYNVYFNLSHSCLFFFFFVHCLHSIYICKLLFWCLYYTLWICLQYFFAFNRVLSVWDHVFVHAHHIKGGQSLTLCFSVCFMLIFILYFVNLSHKEDKKKTLLSGRCSGFGHQVAV